MPNVTYSGTQGIVQSTGTGGFTVSGVGVTLDSETVAFTGNAALSAVGTSAVTSNGAHTGTLASPTNVAGAAGQTKLVHKTTGPSTVQLADANGALAGMLLNAAGDYAFLVWTGTAWLPVASKITA